MAISSEEVNRIAKLARLNFSEGEKQKLQLELSAILDYVDQLKHLDEKITLKIVYDQDAVNLTRNDGVEVNIELEEFLKQAPDREGNYVKVKSVLD
jgi:aspartyl-tRNA(Asn)/glutamyl-tRNA(Gln) amidotransferase subunit C